MKILFTTDTIQRGGKERQLFILSAQLARKGYIINILTFKLTENNFINEYNFKPDQINLIKPQNRFSRYLAFKKLIKTFEPDLVFAWDFETSLYNLCLYKKFKYRFINGSIQHGIRLFRFSHIIRSITCWSSPFVVANSLAGLKANNLKPGKRRFVFYNGIEIKFMNRLSEPKIDILRKKIIPGYSIIPGFVYISVANLVPYKDYCTVIKALSKLKSDFNFYYLIVGDGPMRKKFKEMTRVYGLEKNIILAGRVENVKDYLFVADVMIHSSRGEGISNAILEGMYAGLPVIATNVGGIPETIYPASSMLFPYKDHETLYNCLLKSKGLKESFDPSSEEYQAHLRKFSVETMVRRFEEIIDEILKK